MSATGTYLSNDGDDLNPTNVGSDNVPQITLYLPSVTIDAFPMLFIGAL